MIILPATTPIAATDHAQLNQAGQQQANLSEQSRKATDTVQLSPRSLELATAQSHNRPTGNNSVGLQATGLQPTGTQAVADNEATEAVKDNEAVERQVPVNIQTQRPQTSSIDLVA